MSDEIGIPGLSFPAEDLKKGLATEGKDLLRNMALGGISNLFSSLFSPFTQAYKLLGDFTSFTKKYNGKGSLLDDVKSFLDNTLNWVTGNVEASKPAIANALGVNESDLPEIPAVKPASEATAQKGHDTTGPDGAPQTPGGKPTAKVQGK